MNCDCFFGGGKKGLYRLHPPPPLTPPPSPSQKKKLCRVSSSSVQRNISKSKGVTAAAPTGSDRLSSGEGGGRVGGRGWWPRRRSTQLFLSVWHFSQASILTCDRERRGLQQPSGKKNKKIPPPFFHMEICAALLLQNLTTGTGALLASPPPLAATISFIRKNA